jgi:hypothetical protein
MKSYLQKTKYAINNFKGDIVNNLAVIIPSLVILTMTIGWIVAFMIFVVSGGYSSQIVMIKSNGFSFDAVSAAFTNGTVHILYGKIVNLIVGALLCAQVALFLRSFLKESTKIRRITMIIDLVIMGFFAVGTVFLGLIYTRKIELFEKQTLISSIMDGSAGQGIRIVLLAVTVITIAVVISLIILILKATDKWILGHGSLAALLAYTVLPLLLLFVENVIPLIAGILLLLAIGAVIWFIFMSATDSERESFPASTDRKNSKPEKKTTEKNFEYVDLGVCKLYKVHGALHDYVERDNRLTTGRVCYLHNLRNGKFQIYDKATGKMISEGEIPWRK